MMNPDPEFPRFRLHFPFPSALLISDNLETVHTIGSSTERIRGSINNYMISDNQYGLSISTTCIVEENTQSISIQIQYTIRMNIY